MFTRKQEFWTWFSQIAHQLAQNLDDPALGKQLDKALRREIGDHLSWELGPLNGAECYLAISPQGDRSLLGKAAFVATAPAIPGWKVLVGRQKKDFVDDRLAMELPELGTAEIGRWRFWLQKSALPGRAVVVVFPAGVETAPVDDLVACVEIVLDSLLGELTRIHAVDDFMVTRSVTDLYSGIQPLQLADKLSEFLRPSQ